MISPGPGSPHNAGDIGLCDDLKHEFRVPILGVCLGHQVIARWLGASVVIAPEPVHGRQSRVFHDGHADPSSLFYRIPSGFKVVRYHSLIVEEASIQTGLIVEARTEDGLIMALRRALPGHDVPCWGVQFHPESVATEYGDLLLQNFKSMTEKFLGRTFGSGASPPRIVPGERSSAPSEGKRSSAGHTVLVQELSGSSLLGPQECFDALYSESAVKFWLDSASTPWRCAEHHSSTKTFTKPSKQQGRFSYMGDASGDMAELIEFFVHPADRSFVNDKQASRVRYELRVSKKSSSHGWTVESSQHDVDIFKYLENKLTAYKDKLRIELRDENGEKLEVMDVEEWNREFEFLCGYVGFFGYGLRKLCSVKSCGVTSAWSKEDQQDVKQQGANLAPHYDDSYQSNGNDIYVPDSCFLFADRMVVWDHFQSKCYVVAIDSAETDRVKKLELDRWMRHVTETLRSACGIRGIDRPTQTELKIEEPERGIPSAECHGIRSLRSDAAYREDIRSCQELIRNGETYEVCLTKQLVSEKCLDPEDFYRHLRSSNPSPYAAFFRVDPFYENPKREFARSSKFTICCTSPERFLRIDSQKCVESKPIKGTIRRGVTPKEDEDLAKSLRESEKDRSENLMIVDLVRNDLGRVCELGSVRVPKLLHIETYQTVHQLVSTVTGKIDSHFTTMDAIRAAFPGGSMTGAPKLRTMQIIDKLEPSERGVYSGCLGFLSLSGAADLNIVIRTAILTPNGVTIGTGGAIVSLSDVNDELEETNLKAKALVSAVQYSDC